MLPSMNKWTPTVTVKSTWTTIRLSGESWTPIGEYNNGEEPDEVRFGGYFDGQGHVIKGLNVQPIDGRQSYGLFGYVAWGVVKNLGIVGGTVTSKADDGQEYTGAISGMLSYGRIENCFSTATVSGTAEGSIGGLTGGMRKISSVSNSYNAGTVINPAGMAGGITGYIGSDASVYNCYNMGKVTGGAISGDDYSESTLRSGEEELPSIIDCYYLEGAGSGTLAKALSASDFVTTMKSSSPIRITVRISPGTARRTLQAIGCLFRHSTAVLSWKFLSMMIRRLRKPSRREKATYRRSMDVSVSRHPNR